MVLSVARTVSVRTRQRTWNAAQVEQDEFVRKAAHCPCQQVSLLNDNLLDGNGTVPNTHRLLPRFGQCCFHDARVKIAKGPQLLIGGGKMWWACLSLHFPRLYSYRMDDTVSSLLMPQSVCSKSSSPPSASPSDSQQSVCPFCGTETRRVAVSRVLQYLVSLRPRVSVSTRLLSSVFRTAG